MFIFNWLANIISIIGFILAGFITYFSFYPVRTDSPREILLSKVLDCQSNTLRFKNTDEINDDKVLELKNLMGSDLPIEIMKDATKQLSELAKNAGSSIELKIEYCPISSEKDTFVTKFRQEVDKDSKYFVTGTLDDLKNEVNKLPFANLTGLSFEINTVYARSNFCNTSINRSSLYFFTVTGSKTPVELNSAVLFSIQVIPDSNTSEQNTIIKNVLESGHYIKTRIYCNE